MGRKTHNLNIEIGESIKKKLSLSSGFRVYRHISDKHAYYRDAKKRKRDVKAVEHHFPGIAQILKSVKEMENECVYCRLEKDKKVDTANAVFLELLKIATSIIAAEQAYSKELEYRMEICSLFLDENFQLLQIIKSLQEQNVVLDNELIKCLDEKETEYAESSLDHSPQVDTHDIYLQDISQGWESIDWRGLEMGEYKLQRAYVSQESDSISNDANDGFGSTEFFSNAPIVYDYPNRTSFGKSELSAYKSSTLPNANEDVALTLNEFITPKSYLPVSNTSNLRNLSIGDLDSSNEIPSDLQSHSSNPIRHKIKDKKCAGSAGEIFTNDYFRPFLQDFELDNSYKSLDSYENSEASFVNDRDLYKFHPFPRGKFIEKSSNGSQAPIDEAHAEEYRITNEDLNSFQELFSSRIQYYNEGSECLRLLNAENAYLHNIIQNKLIIGNQINLEDLSDNIKLKERLKIHKEHWERLEKLLSNYISQNLDGKLNKYYTSINSTDANNLQLAKVPNNKLQSMDEDVLRYLSVFASVSAILSERSFEKLLEDIVFNKGQVGLLIASLQQINNQKYTENHILKDTKLQLSIQTELCDRLSSLCNINSIGESHVVSELKKQISQMSDKVKELEKEKEDMLLDCKNAANAISMMESDIQEKSMSINQLHSQINNLQAKVEEYKIQSSMKNTVNFAQDKIKTPRRNSRNELCGSNGMDQSRINRDSMEGVMRRALGNCLKDLEYAESCAGCTTLVSSDSSISEILNSDTDDSDISITRVQNHPILPRLLSMLDRLHSGYMSLVRTLKDQCVSVDRRELNKYVGLMDGLASLIKRYNTSPKYDHEIETILIMMHSEYTLSSSNLLYLLNIMAKLAELTQIVLLDRELDTNSRISGAKAGLEMAEERIKLLELEKGKILAEKNDLKSNISELKREIDGLKYPLDRIEDRVDRYSKYYG